MSQIIPNVCDDTSVIEEKYIWFINWVKKYVSSLNIKKSQFTISYLEKVIFIIPPTILTYNTRKALSTENSVNCGTILNTNRIEYKINKDIISYISRKFGLRFFIDEHNFYMTYPMVSILRILKKYKEDIQKENKEKENKEKENKENKEKEKKEKKEKIEEVEEIDDNGWDYYFYSANQTKFEQYLSNKITNINNLLKNNIDDEYNFENDTILVEFNFIMIYDKKNNIIHPTLDGYEDTVMSFKDKIGSICNGKINIFLSTSGYIIYEYNNNYSRRLITTDNYTPYMFKDYRSKNKDEYLYTIDTDDHHIPKIYKLYLINLIKINPELSILESIENLRKYEFNNNIFYDQLTFMENELYKKLNDQSKLNQDILSKLEEQIKINKQLNEVLLKLI
jgi:hypothetical protein